MQLFVGVPVTCGAGDRLAFDEAGGVGLCTFGIDHNRCERLALGLGVSRGGDTADSHGH
ncbi:hypothetical protein D3C73_1627540 [compost metagenome]